MNKKYQYFILLALATVAIWYGYTHRELFLNLKRISLLNLALLTILVFAAHIVNAYKFKCLIQVFSIHLDFKEWFGLSVCNTMFNYYLPARGGLAVRAYYLKKKHAFPYSHYTSLLAGSQVMSCLVSAGVGLGLTLLCKPVHGIFYWKFAALFLGLLLLTAIGTLLLLLLLKLGKKFANARLNSILERFEEGLSFFLKNRQLVLRFSALHIALVLVMGARFFVCFSAINLDILPLQTLMIPSLTTFSLMLPLTPANLGVREGIVSGSAYLFGLQPDQALLAALIDRGAAVLVTFLFGLIFSRILLSDIRLPKDES